MADNKTSKLDEGESCATASFGSTSDCSQDNTLVVWMEIDLKRLFNKGKQELQHEIDILSMFHHPNVISCYNHFLDRSSLLIEMEYANGNCLHKMISAQKELFAEKVIVWYFHQLVSAVAYIHSCDILHRYIKTLNIFLTKNGLVKLGDNLSSMKATQHEKVLAQKTIRSGSSFFECKQLHRYPYRVRKRVMAHLRVDTLPVNPQLLFHHLPTLKRTALFLIGSKRSLHLLLEEKSVIIEAQARMIAELQSQLGEAIDMSQHKRDDKDDIPNVMMLNVDSIREEFAASITIRRGKP